MSKPILIKTFRCFGCQRKVVMTPHRQGAVKRAREQGKVPRVWCGRWCSTKFYNKQMSVRYAVEEAEEMLNRVLYEKETPPVNSLQEKE